jgi:hypothetical protein
LTVRLAIAAYIALAACGSAPQTRIDGTSPETFSATSADARHDLAVTDRLAFDRAMKSPPGKRFGDNEEEIRDFARATYNGMTAAEVIDYAQP